MSSARRIELQTQPVLSQPARRKPVGLRLVDVVTTTILIIGALGVIAPFLWIFSSSVRPYTEAFSLPPVWLPLQWDFTNYQRLANVGLISMPVLFANSFKIAAVVTLGIVATSSLAGYAFARLRFPGRNGLFALLLSSLMIPIQVTIIPLFIIMRALGLVDTHWAIMVPGLVGAFAPGLSGVFGVFLMRQFFLTLPQDLLDAGKIDGAGQWQTFARIALPLARSNMAALSIIAFASTWNDYFLPLIFLSSADQLTLPVGILALREPMNAGNPMVLAAVALSVLPTLVLFVIGQRWIVDSFIRVGVKG